MKFTKKSALRWAHPLVQDWFLQKFDTVTEPQQQGWPHILAHETTLISAPTGSGKTLSAFLVCIDQLVRKALAGTLDQQTEVLYISPLKALGNDVHKNLLQPLHEIAKLAKERDLPMAKIDVAVRTGDTLARERLAMLKTPPHILVTTPESLYILLTAEKSREILKTINTVIVDEIHAMVNDKRGTHLTLSLERLEAITHKTPQRIGLSATQKPIEMVAHFLAGNKRPTPAIINIGHIRQLELQIEVPKAELGAVAANTMWDEIYDRLAELSKDNRAMLVFVNTRRLAERIAHHLTERLGEEQVAAHHGSLSRKIRLAVETKLKNGELKILVATASLELGIDIGTIDLVCQIGSPRAIAAALQRVGRAGHWHGAISKGRIFATTRDELLECAALIYAIKQGDLDALILPQQPLDILSQQIIATCATGDWHEDDLFNLVKCAYPYKNLNRKTFETVLNMLAEGVAGSRGRYGAYLFRDRVNNIVKARRSSRLVAIMNGGAIPDNGLFNMILEPQGIKVGTLDEDFAIESNRGDIILLGSNSWMIQRVESASGRVIVEDAHGAPPTVPFWRGEAPTRTHELSAYVALLRQKLSDMLPQMKPAIIRINDYPNATTAINWLKKNCGFNDSAATQLLDYLLQGRAVLGAVPTQKTIIAERFFDESGGMQLVIHAPFGARINKAWGLALRKRFCRSFNFELQAAATDDGINIALAEQHSFVLADVFKFLHSNSIKKTVTQAVLQSPLFTSRWRWVATRALALVRFRVGKKVPTPIQRMLADDLLAAVFPDAAACQDNLGGRDIELPDHPLINETMKDALTEALDLEGLTKILQQIQNGEINCIAVDTPIPSPFSHEILNANPYAFLDDAPLEERRARAVEMRRVLPESVLQEVGSLDEEVIKEVQQQAWPDIRNEDELHDTLQTLVAVPDTIFFTSLRGAKRRGNPDICAGLPRRFAPRNDGLEDNTSWQLFFIQLSEENRAATAIVANQEFWYAAEKSKTFASIYPEAVFKKTRNDIEKNKPAQSEAITTMIRGWMLHLGPTTSTELSELLQLDLTNVEQTLLQLEASGLILRGHFRSAFADRQEWCERRLLARIHRMTVAKLRQEIEPVTAMQFFHWLLQWQHLAPQTQLTGEQGLIAIIRQLQGFEISAKAWEREIFSPRLVDYDPQMLDHLCLTGVIAWGRISTHSALQDLTETHNKKRVIPISNSPITFYLRNETAWLPNLPNINPENLDVLSNVAKKIQAFLTTQGASFFADIERGIGHLKSEIETALWELITAGIITADGFDNLRAFIDSRRRADSRHRHYQARYSTARWSLLRNENINTHEQQIEAICWMLLQRYGVIFRDLLVREKNIPAWRELLLALRRLEDRGEIRGGRFVTGFLGEQFALPYAVESLRASKKQIVIEETITLAAADPLNLVGIILPGDRVAAIAKRSVSITNTHN